MIKGIICEIEEFAVHDGPGIRTVVFMKGCPLQCNWCHNPEGQSFKKEIMVNRSACINCRKCAGVCRKEVCDACGDCINICPLRLKKIVGKEYDAKTLAKELLRDKDLYEKSNGGVTFSGGEPLAQYDFLLETIEQLKTVHIVVETSGYAPVEVFQRVANCVDLLIMDIKHTDPYIHKKVTGADNALILENLLYICNSDTKFRIRIPLIPGINDNYENMDKTAELLENSLRLEKVELLPYHKTAGAKYSMIGKHYNPGFNTNEISQIFLEPFQKRNIRCEVL